MKPGGVRANLIRSQILAIAILMGLLSPTLLWAQRGGGGGSKGGDSTTKQSEDDDTGVPVCPQITGSHPLLEKLTQELRLTCAQEAKLLPLMHDEEAVSRPLMAYAAFTPQERQAMLLQVELAARAQVRPFLQPEQQKKSDEEAARAAGKPPKKAGKKMPIVSADAFAGEEVLSSALDLYSALTVAQKKAMLLQVKQAARRDGAPTLTAEQAAKIDADIALLK